MKSLPEISNWDNDNLLDLPQEENEIFEYKSSKTPLDQLKYKISKAASAFWNSGGGIFIVGVDDNGKIDGGIPNKAGKQNIRDWIDNAIKLTEPVGEYEIIILPYESNKCETIDNMIIAVIKFYESNILPHMAYDKKYYIRVGAHSEGANHFLVEALRAFRSFSKPNLKGIMRYHPSKPNIEELVIIAINDAVALNIELTFRPFPKALKDYVGEGFPLEISAIDRQNPFRMDISVLGIRDQIFGDEPVSLLLSYEDILGNKYSTEQLIDPQKNLQPLTIGEDINVKLVKAIEKLVNKL